MKNEFFLLTDCTNSNAVGPYGECITEALNSPHLKEISNARFITHYAKEAGIIDEALAVANCDKIKMFKNDFGVSCYSSLFQSIPCLIVKASGIEYIFIAKEHSHLPFFGEDIAKRYEAAKQLASLLEHDEAYMSIKTKSKRKKYLEVFTAAHIEKLKEYRLTLSVVLNDEKELTPEIVQIDNEAVLHKIL